jgi:hypothetical protein
MSSIIQLNLLQVSFIISGIILFYVGIDIARRQKFNALHLLVFILIALGLITFTFFPRILNIVGALFGLQRGADVLVYGSILFLLYMSVLMLSKVEKNREDLTKVVRE